MASRDFAGRDLQFRPEEFFSGRSAAWGLFQDRSGAVRRRFRIEADGVWDAGTLTLTEDFTYDDGETERRVWRIRKTGENGYEGVADDLIGVARGAVCGNTLHWTYQFALKLGSRRLSVRFDDRLLLLDDDLLVNRAQVSKFGLRIGEVTCVFRRLPAVRAEIVPMKRAAGRSLAQG